MKKNVASQSIGAQMITAADGTAFTGSVTVYVTGDAGTQALGSVGSGVCTSEGNGYHTYAPAQAETNYDQIAFTFIGTGAIPATVQVFTGFPQTVDNATGIADIPTVSEFNARTLAAADYFDPAVDTVANVTTVATLTGHTAQTGDSFARLGAPAGASVSADIAAIEAQTDDIGAAGAGLTAVPWNAAWDAEVQSECADALTAYGPNTTTPPTAAAVADAVWDETQSTHVTAGSFGEIATEIASILADTNELQVDDIPGLIAALNDVSTADINAQVLDVLNTDTFAEPSGVPAATTTLVTKLGYLYMALRNQIDVTATKKTFYDDSGTAEWEKDLSDDGTTYSESEGNAI